MSMCEIQSRDAIKTYLQGWVLEISPSKNNPKHLERINKRDWEKTDEDKIR